VSLLVHADWQTFLTQQGFEIRQGRAYARSNDIDLAATRCVDLNHFVALPLVGPDASSFLEGYLTCEMATLDESRALNGAYCNIKGRVVADVVVALVDAQPTLVVHASLHEEVVTSLRKYLAFSRSRFQGPASMILGIVNPPMQPGWPVEPLSVARIHGGHAIAIPGATPRTLLLLGAEQAKATWLEYAAQAAVADASVWDLLDIRAGIAHVESATSAAFLPQMLDYDKTGAISFTKGCYLGQEIVARTQHLGRPKRHLQRLHWSGANPAPVGTALEDADGHRVGTLVSIAAVTADRGEALAVLNDGAASSLRADEVVFVEA
jgi:hypothetical protein